MRARIATIQTWFAAAILLGFGAYQLSTLNVLREPWPACFAAASLLTGFEVAFRQRWSVPLVLILAVPVIIICGWVFWLALVDGTTLDLMHAGALNPLAFATAGATAAANCCYVAAVYLWRHNAKPNNRFERSWGLVFGKPGRESMIWVNCLRCGPPRTRVAEPHR
jgi:hypothetical protein